MVYKHEVHSYMYESSSDQTSYPRLVGAVKWRYDEVLQVYLGVFVWITLHDLVMVWLRL